MKKALAAILLPAFAGCFSMTATPVARTEWNVAGGARETLTAEPKFGVTRLSQIVVRAPYDVRNFAVERADLSTAFDPYNLFASAPAQLLKGAVHDHLAESGLFKAVVSSSSAANADAVAEVTITELKLQSGEEATSSDRLDAVVELSILVLNEKRVIIASAKGSGRIDAKSAPYSTAFSKALSVAMVKAMKDL